MDGFVSLLLQIIENDIMAHQTSVDCLVEEYQRMILESSLEADGLKAKMEAMAVCRDKLQDLFHEKQRLLEISLEEVWLKDKPLCCFFLDICWFLEILISGIKWHSNNVIVISLTAKCIVLAEHLVAFSLSLFMLLYST